MKIENFERRNINITDSNLSIRAKTSEEGKRNIQGYAVVFNSDSHLIFERGKLFVERIHPNAFEGVLDQPNLDVLATYQHNENFPVARLQPSTNKRSLELSVDENGLFFSFEVPNTSTGNDLYELISRNIISECSFVFSVPQDGSGEIWSKRSDGQSQREITKVQDILDITMCVNGQYQATFSEASQRSIEKNLTDEIEVDERQYYDIELEFLKAKYFK